MGFNHFKTKGSQRPRVSAIPDPRAQAPCANKTYAPCTGECPHLEPRLGLYPLLLGRAFTLNGRMQLRHHCVGIRTPALAHMEAPHAGLRGRERGGRRGGRCGTEGEGEGGSLQDCGEKGEGGSLQGRGEKGEGGSLQGRGAKG